MNGIFLNSARALMRGQEGLWSQGDPKRASRLGKIRAQGDQERFHERRKSQEKRRCARGKNLKGPGPKNSRRPRIKILIARG